MDELERILEDVWRSGYLQNASADTIDREFEHRVVRNAQYAVEQLFVQEHPVTSDDGLLGNNSSDNEEIPI